MSAYEELVERCCMLFRELESSAPNDEFTHRAYAKTLLTSVLRTLETVTGEMEKAEIGVEPDPDGRPYLGTIYLAMLRASALNGAK